MGPRTLAALAALVVLLAGMLAYPPMRRWLATYAPWSLPNQATSTATATQHTEPADEPALHRPGPVGSDQDTPPESQAWQRCADAWRHDLRRLRETIDPARGAQDAYIHLLLGQSLGLSMAPETRDGMRAQTLAARKRWPDDIDLAWMERDECTTRATCETANRELRRVDGGNMATWMYAMQEAAEAGDKDALHEALQGAAAAPTMDSRLGTRLVRLAPLLQSLPVPPACLDPSVVKDIEDGYGHPVDAADIRNLFVLAQEFAHAIPPLQALSETCAAQTSLTDASVRRNCDRSLQRLAKADTLVERMVAMSTLIRMHGPGEASTNFRETYRQLRWMMQQQQEGPPVGPYDLLAMGEATAIETHLRRLGRWPPPPDWLPPDEPSRRLILEGRR